MAAELDALKGLVDELSSALADMVVAAQEGQANTGEISTTLAEMLEVLRNHKAPDPVFNVPPAQVTVMPAASGDFKLTYEYDGKGRLVSTYVKRINKGA